MPRFIRPNAAPSSTTWNISDKKDRRTNLIHLTKDGKELEERARIIANQTLKEALQGITLEELSVSQEVLRKIFFNTKD